MISDDSNLGGIIGAGFRMPMYDLASIIYEQ